MCGFGVAVSVIGVVSYVAASVLLVPVALLADAVAPGAHSASADATATSSLPAVRALRLSVAPCWVIC